MKVFMYDVADISLAPSGRNKLDWALCNMPLLTGIRERFEREKPFDGLRIALSVHMEAKTAVLSAVLAAGGAEMFVTGSNPLSTQDDVAAALAEAGFNIFARHGVDADTYAEHLRRVIECAPDIIVDDGGDLVNLIYNDYPQFVGKVLGGCEETTTGILRLSAMEKAGKLPFPMFAVNNARSKYLFDNRYGTGQSVWDAINRTTNLVVAGKHVVVAGYGWCGKGVAMRAKGFGAHVIITEVDPIKALEATMDGFDVMPMDKAAETGDLFVTVTGCRDVVTLRHFPLLKDGAVLCNAGHFNVEVDMESLEKYAVSKRVRRKNITGYTLPGGRCVNVLAEGRLVNLAAGDGHPVEIMDMSFAIQALCAEYIAKNGRELERRLLPVPEEIDREVAVNKLASLGLAVDKLTPAQSEYLSSYNV